LLSAGIQNEHHMTEEVTVNDIAALLEVSRRSAIQRMSRLVKKNQAIKLNMPTVGNPARFKLLVSKESLLHTQKFAGPKTGKLTGKSFESKTVEQLKTVVKIRQAKKLKSDWKQ
jgi:hypothetical protein